MSFDYVLSDELEAVLRKIGRKDKQFAIAIRRKIDQIVILDETAILHFKNQRSWYQKSRIFEYLSGNLKEYKRVHIGSFVLMFKIHRSLIVFDKFMHHDRAYRK